jgi:hypothetical protein
MSTKETAGAAEVRSQTIEEAKELARFLKSKDIPVYFHSAPGIGKSAIMHQLATEERIGFKDIRVSTMLPEDLTGIPVPDMEKRVAVWLRANFWPSVEEDGEYGIIAFDELSDANRGLQSCIYRVILDRQIGDFKLPPGWWPTAAGNRREDRAAAQSISTALANRFSHIHVRADDECWRAWANVNDIHPMLIGFIKFRPGLLHSMEGADLLSFPSPRTWAMASKVFDAPAALRHRALCAIVGEGAAMEVDTFFRTVDLPDFEEIIKNPLKTEIPEQPASRFALSSLLSRKMDMGNIAQIYKYIMRDDFGADFSAVVILDATKRDQSLCETETFNKWARSNKSIKL